MDYHKVVKLLNDIYIRFKPYAKSNEMDFIFEKDKESVLADIDSEAITKSVSNLLTNACKFANSQIKMSLETKPEENKLSISVKDDGPGIPKNKINKILEPFEQIYSKQKSQGTGIGLTFTKSLVELHHGILVFETGKQTKGAHVRIELFIRNEQLKKRYNLASTEINTLPTEEALEENIENGP